MGFRIFDQKRVDAMNGDKLIEVILWIFCLVLAIVFFYNGAGKIMGSPYQVAQFRALGISSNLLIIVGVVECLGGLMLTIPRLSVAGGAILGVIMLISAALHLFHDNPTSSFRAVVIVVMLAVICYLRFRHRTTRNYSE